ncbi:hypothetical protein [Pedobacter gandavensis]|uniref:hypothetical protein n=1 Tax=Pedobacter gandavensis TaxID=2679963 RepID=UPI0029312532|nr:hypothetical protein [Pedobacter gandavensis]
MQSEVRLLLLRLVQHNGNLTPLIKQGFEYTQIIKFIDILAEEEKISKLKGKIFITDSGLNEIDQLNKKFNRRNSSMWIEPDTSSKISEFDKKDVFLPDQNDLSF